MRRAAKVDDNQAEIVAALYTIGARVQSLAMVGNGCPDLLVGYRGEFYLLEIKDGRKIPSKQELTPAEERWHRAWADFPNIHVVYSAARALRVITGQWGNR